MVKNIHMVTSEIHCVPTSSYWSEKEYIPGTLHSFGFNCRKQHKINSYYLIRHELSYNENLGLYPKGKSRETRHKKKKKKVKDEALNKKISFNLFYLIQRKRAYLTLTRLRKGKPKFSQHAHGTVQFCW